MARSRFPLPSSARNMASHVDGCNEGSRQNGAAHLLSRKRRTSLYEGPGDNRGELDAELCGTWLLGAATPLGGSSKLSNTLRASSISPAAA